MIAKKLLISIFIFILLFPLNNLLFCQKNTILIIADDLSADYLGCFSSTTDTAITPNIRQLANKGIRFKKVWSAPLCSPARSGILTGRYPFRTGIGGVITSATSPQIDTAEYSIAKLLKYYFNTHYQTACIGKWHLTANTPLRRLNPNKLGFDLYSGNFNGAIPNYYNYIRIKQGIVDTVTQYATTQTIDDAIDWLDTISTTKPFFLWLGFNAPHDPFHVPPSNLCDTNGLIGTATDIGNNPKKYFKAALQAMDNEIGRLISYLDQNSLTDSTNIIFIGDNGNQSQVAQISNPFKSKGTIYNYGVQVPMIIAGPSVVNGNRDSYELISTVDLFSTILEMNGFSNWRNYIPQGTSVDSKSFQPILTNISFNSRSWIFTETFNPTTTTNDGKTIRNHDYHLLRFDNGNEEFYNITSDIEENNNLLINSIGMSPQEINQYNFLCDSLSALTGIPSCGLLDKKETISEDNITLSPNPTSGVLSLHLNKVLISSATIISIFSIYGNMIESYEINNQSGNIDISNYPDGSYLIRLTCKEYTLFRVVIKQNK